jgi:RuvB-like protein 1 (pontin 52)
MIVKTDGYTRDQVGKVVQVRATVEGLKLAKGVIDRLAVEGEKSSLRYGLCLGLKLVSGLKLVLIAFAPRYALQLLSPASILAQLAGRAQIELEDIGEMIEMFLDAKTSASNLADGGGFDAGKM